MMSLTHILRTMVWLVHKDLLRELRAPRMWPSMLLLGLVLSITIQLQIDLPPEQTRSLSAGLLWLAVFFAGSFSLDRSLASEREEGCWQALRLYPVGPSAIFLAKTTANFLALSALTAVLTLAFVVFADIRLLIRPWPLVAIAVTANLGFAALGTLISAVTSRLTQRGAMLSLLVFPLVSPVVIGAAQATRRLVSPDSAEWTGWLGLLACFAVVYTTLGTLLFEFLIED